MFTKGQHTSVLWLPAAKGFEEKAMETLMLLAYLQYSWRMAAAARRKNLQRLQPFAENKQAYLAVKQTSTLMQNNRYTKALLDCCTGEALVLSCLESLTGTEKEVFLARYRDQCGWKEVADRLQLDRKRAKKLWEAALSKILTNINRTLPDYPSRDACQSTAEANREPEINVDQGCWYAVRVLTGREELLAFNMKRFLEKNPYVITITAVSKRVITFSPAGISENYHSVFPGYIFVQVREMNARVWQWLKSFPGVIWILSDCSITGSDMRRVLGYRSQEVKLKLPGCDAALSYNKFPLDLLRKVWSRSGVCLEQKWTRENFSLPTLLRTMRFAF